MVVSGSFEIPIDHPSLAGHFPGRPLVPGVVLLAEIQAIIGPARTLGFDAVKFLAPVLPGQQVDVQAEITTAAARFTATVGATKVVTGIMRFSAA